MAFQTVVPKQSRAAGSIQSGWQALPAAQRITLRALMDLADIQDSTLTMTFRIEGSNDGGATFFLLQEQAWTGGLANRDGSFSPPTGSVSTTPMPSHARLFAQWPRRLPLGLEVEIV